MEIKKSLSATLKRLTGDRLPDYALHYYESLEAQVDLVKPPSAQGGEPDAMFLAAYEDARRFTNIPRETLTWADLMKLDLAIVRILPFECLRLKVAELRNRLGTNATPLPHELSPRLESIEASQIAALKCEAESLVTQLWQCRIARNSRDCYVGELRRIVFLAMLAIIVGAYAFAYSLAKTPIHLVIFVAGMVGALISILRRLQSVASAAALSLDQGNDLSALNYERFAILISLLSGGVFATLLYVAFIAGVAELSTKLAPEFVPPAGSGPNGGVDFGYFAHSVSPKEAADYAKVVVWSFAAGFFEQLVPDVLDRMMKRDEKLKK